MARWVANGSGSTDASTGAGTGASTVAMERVEIVTRGGRRTFTAEEKAALLVEAAEPGARVLEVASRRGICASLIHRWRREAEGRPVKAREVRRPPRVVPVVIGPVAAGAAPEAVTPASSGSAGTGVEVVLRNGRVLRVGAEADVAMVARLAVALEA